MCSFLHGSNILLRTGQYIPPNDGLLPGFSTSSIMCYSHWVSGFFFVFGFLSLGVWGGGIDALFVYCFNALHCGVASVA
jgi:hypothetical protein